jgi:hypothetical protein
MPQTQCCVPGCVNRGGHVFPTNVELKKKWLHAIRRKETGVNKINNTWEPKSKSAVVCQSHFKADDYISVTYHGE